MTVQTLLEGRKEEQREEKRWGGGRGEGGRRISGAHQLTAWLRFRGQVESYRAGYQLFSSGLCRKEGKEGRGEKGGGEGRGEKGKGRAGSFLEGTRVKKATPANHRGSGQAIQFSSCKISVT